MRMPLCHVSLHAIIMPHVSNTDSIRHGQNRLFSRHVTRWHSYVLLMRHILFGFTSLSIMQLSFAHARESCMSRVLSVHI